MLRMVPSWARAPACLLVIVLSTNSSGFASAPHTIEGCIQDSSKTPIKGASVVVRSLQTNQISQSRSDGSGCFLIDALSPGTVSISVMVEAFEPYEDTINLNGAIVLLPIKLDLLPIRNFVTVTAQRSVTPTKTLGLSLDVVERSELEAAKIWNISDALRNMAGVAVQQTGANGITNFFVRGGESDYNKVLIDGIPVNLPGDTYDFAHIPTDNIDRLEIVRGPQSALFGSDAMSSVVQVFTREGIRSPSVDYSLEGGSFNSLRQSASLRGGLRKLYFSNTFSRFDTDNKADNNDYRNSSYFGNASYSPSSNQSARITLMNVSVQGGTPGPTAKGFMSFDPTARMHRRERAARLSVSSVFGSRLNQKVAYSIHDLDQVFIGSFGPFEVASTRHRAEYRGELVSTKGNAFSFGLDFDREIAPVANVRRDRNNVGYYVQQQMRMGDSFHLTAGLRIEDNTSFGTTASPRFAISKDVWSPNRFFGLGRLRFAIGSGIKAPRFLESFSNNPFFLGNSNLEAERSRSWEVGWEQGLANDSIIADIGWFDNRFTNLIQLVPVSNGSNQYQNIGLTTARGLEFRLRFNTKKVKAKANYTFLEGKIEESIVGSFPFRPGDPLLRRPKHSGDFRLTIIADKWTASWTSRFVGDRADSDFFTHFPSLSSNKFHSVSNIAAALDLTPQISSFVRIDNVFNSRYQEVLGFKALPRGLSIGIQVSWDGRH